MTLMRKLALLAVTAVAAMAMTAGSASAAVELRLEAGGAHCGAVTYVNHGAGATGCVVHFRNVGAFEFGSPVGMVTCTTFEKTGRWNEAVSGFIYTISMAGCSSSIVECNESGVDDNWPMQLNAENQMELSFCATAFGFLNIQCTTENLSLTDNASHTGDVISTGPNHVACDEGGGNSLQGTLTIENGASEPEIEVID